MNPDDPLGLRTDPADPLGLKKKPQPKIGQHGIPISDDTEEEPGYAQKALGGIAALDRNIPGAEALQAGLRALARRQPYTEALNDIRGAEGSANKWVRRYNNVAGGAVAAAATPAGPLMNPLGVGGSAALQGARYGAAEGLLEADPVSLKERIRDSGKGVVTGAIAGKASELLPNIARTMFAKRLGKGAMERTTQMGEEDAVAYGRALAEGKGATDPAVTATFARPGIKGYVDAARNSESLAGADDATLLHETYKRLSERQRALQSQVERAADYKAGPAREIADIELAKQHLLDVADKIMPSYRGAVTGHAINAGDYEAFQTGTDAANRAMRKASVAGRNLDRTTSDAFLDDIKSMSVSEAKSAIEGVLGRAAARTGRTGLTSFSPLKGFGLPKSAVEINRLGTLLDALDRQAGNVRGNSLRRALTIGLSGKNGPDQIQNSADDDAEASPVNAGTPTAPPQAGRDVTAVKPSGALAKIIGEKQNPGPSTPFEHAVEGLGMATDFINPFKLPQTVGAIARGVGHSAQDAFRPAIGSVRGPELDRFGLPAGSDPERDSEVITEENTPDAIPLSQKLRGALNTTANAALPFVPGLSLAGRLGTNAALGAINDPDDPIRGGTAGALIGEAFARTGKAGEALERPAIETGERPSRVVGQALEEVGKTPLAFVAEEGGQASRPTEILKTFGIEGAGKSDLPRAMAQKIQEGSGFTFDPRTGAPLAQGFAVGIGNAVKRELKVAKAAVTPELIQQYIAKNADYFEKNPDAVVGGWVDEKGMAYIEPSTLVPDLPTAAHLGLLRGEKAVGDLSKYARGEDGTVSLNNELLEALGVARPGDLPKKFQALAEVEQGASLLNYQPWLDYAGWKRQLEGGLARTISDERAQKLWSFAKQYQEDLHGTRPEQAQVHDAQRPDVNEAGAGNGAPQGVPPVRGGAHPSAVLDGTPLRASQTLARLRRGQPGKATFLQHLIDQQQENQVRP